MLVVQAIKSIGENNITSEFLCKLENKFNAEEWLKIKKNSTKATGWVYKIISEIADKKDK